MRQARGVVMVFWGWSLFIAGTIFIVMAYTGMLDGIGSALYELLKDTARFLLD